MKLDKRKAVILAIILIAGTTIAIGAQQGALVSIVENLRGIEEIDRQIMDSIYLGNLPDFFEASLIIEEHGYTGQIHTVYLNISHNRPETSTWLADGNYSLGLEEMDGTIIEPPIMFGSFTDAGRNEPFRSLPCSWRPTCLNGTYNIVLSLNDLEWISGYIIDTIAGTGGTISPPGPVTVREGGSLSFSIEADEGYVIEDVLDNGVSINPLVGSVSDTHIIGYIQEDYTIHATFIEIHTITASAGEGGSISPSGLVQVPEGDDQTFTITADAGYSILNVTVDSFSEGVISEYTFTNVQDNHAIDASFQEMNGSYSDVNTALEIISENCSGWTSTITGATFNGETSLSITPGSSISFLMQIEDLGAHAGYYWNIHVDVERVGGGDRHTVRTIIGGGPFPTGTTRNVNSLFSAEGGDWIVIVIIDAVYLP